MDLFNKKKIEKIQTQLNVYKSLYEKERCKKQELTKLLTKLPPMGYDMVVQKLVNIW